MGPCSQASWRKKPAKKRRAGRPRGRITRKGGQCHRSQGNNFEKEEAANAVARQRKALVGPEGPILGGHLTAGLWDWLQELAVLSQCW